MIKPGIKVGPDDWRERLQKSGARYCEVWFRIDQRHLYQEMFSYLKKQGINAGLHFWGILKGGYEPNVAYPGPTLRQTLKLIRHTIDVAASFKLRYVNIHCGNRQLIKVNLKKQIFSPIGAGEVSLHDSENTLEKSWLLLHQYARRQNVLLLVETVPARTATGSMLISTSRLKPTSQFAVPVKIILKLAQKHHLFVTNDFCHTFADEYDQPLDALWRTLYTKSKLLAPYTKLLHLNSVIPPYNGTDSHHGITDNDFNLPGIFPPKEKLIELLKFFKNRNDVWAINEPSHQHTTNFRALTKILKLF
ncbi:MAG: TIM barrel protein [Candidatus Chisholmbacteria bacterium]|nr:TIM barrel protein [Candidatus Chisholmbacteria bacterium]